MFSVPSGSRSIVTVTPSRTIAVTSTRRDRSGQKATLTDTRSAETRAGRLEARRVVDDDLLDAGAQARQDLEPHGPDLDLAVEALLGGGDHARAHRVERDDVGQRENEQDEKAGEDRGNERQAANEGRHDRKGLPLGPENVTFEGLAEPRSKFWPARARGSAARRRS